MKQPKIRLKGFDSKNQSYSLKDICEINPKSTLPDVFEYVDLESVVGTEIISHRTEKKESAPSRAQRLAKKGDIFYQTVRPYQKNNYLFNIDEANYVFSTGYAQLRTKLNSAYLFTLMQSPSFVDKVMSECIGTSYPAINPTNLSKIIVNIIDNVHVQHHIASYFSNLDSLIQSATKKMESLKQVKAASLQAMFPQEGETVPKVRFKGFEGEWKTVKLGEVGTFRSNGVDKKIYPNDPIVNLLNYLDVYNFKAVTNLNCHELMQVSATEKQIKECDIKKGDIFFTPSSETAEDIGHVMVAQEDLSNTCYSYHLVRFRPNPNQFYITFPNYGFQTEAVRKQMRIAAKGVQRFVMGKLDFENIIVVVPSYEEQKMIGDFLSTLDTQITLQSQRVEKLKQIKSACLDQMFV